MRNHGQIVAHQDVGQAVVAFQSHQQIEYLGLYRNIECRGGFVQQDDLRVGDQRARDGNPLALATRYLVGIAKSKRGIESDLFQCRYYPFVDPVEAVDPGRFAYYRINGVAWMQ
jgi:hypothetical protein